MYRSGNARTAPQRGHSYTYERLWTKPFHFGLYVWAEDPALFLDIFVLASRVLPWNASDAGGMLSAAEERAQATAWTGEVLAEGDAEMVRAVRPGFR